MLNINKSIFFLFSSLFLILLLTINVFEKPSSLIPFSLSLLGIFVLLWYLSITKINKILLSIVFLYNIFTLHLPFLYMTVFYSIDDFNQFMHFRDVTFSDYLDVNLLVLVFDILLVVFLLLFQKLKISLTSFKYLNKSVFRENKQVVLMLFLLLLAYTSKLYLISTGVWFFYEMNQIETTKIPFFTLANLFEKIDLFILLFITYKFKSRMHTKTDLIIFALVIVISLIFAVISTSKAKVLILFLPLFFILMYSKRKSFGLLLVLIFSISMQDFFDLMLELRHSGGISSIYSKQLMQYNDSGIAIHDNKLLGRLDYQTILARTLKTYPAFPDNYNFTYTNNIIGLIPRAIWPGKPTTGLDMNKVGHEIGVLYRTDNITAVGITPLGVSYYLLGVSGVFFISFFMALIIFTVNKLLNDKYWSGYLLIIMMAIQLARNGTYVNIIPSMVQIFILFYSLSLLFKSTVSLKENR